MSEIVQEESTVSYRSCNLCEAVCGLSIEHDGTEVISIRGDKEDPLSKGHICPKGTALADIHSDPDRLQQPMLKGEDGTFSPISWAAAYDLVESKISAIHKDHGKDAVAMYLGNPTVHNFGALVFQKFLREALDSKNQYAATSLDQLPHHLAASQMFGHGLLIPVPDIDRTDHMVILGANPAASNGSLMTAPGMRDRLRAIRDRGGKVILIDPRETESAKLADQHHFILPGTDVYLLAGLLHVLLEDDLLDLSEYSYLRNARKLSELFKPWTPELAASHCGIPAEQIREMAHEFANAKTAVIYGRMGASTQAHGGLVHWLINTINLVTGNLDRAGGQMFAKPAFPLVGRKGTAHEFRRWSSRVRGLPEFEGSLPTSVLAEEILTPGEGQIKALITNAGNPVLSAPNGKKMEQALEGLDFYLALDIYINESTRHADLILPSPSGLETNHFDLVFNAVSVHNVAKYSAQTIPPKPGLSYDWEIMKELSFRIGKPGFLKSQILKWATPDRILNLGLSFGPYGIFQKPFSGGLNLKRLKEKPHGVDLGPLEPCLPSALRTEDRELNVVPAIYEERLAQLPSKPAEPAPGFQLIGRRHLRDNNSWMHNSPRLMKGKNRCTLMMNEEDASRLQLEEGQVVAVTSRVGEIKIPLEVTTAIMPGVVSIPHGYGHTRTEKSLVTAEAHAGVSINDLTDDQVVDELTGNAAFSGQHVTIAAA